MFSNGNLKTPQFSIFNFQFPCAGYGGRLISAPTACMGYSGASRTPPPTAERPRFCHCEPVRTLAWQSASPVPFFNVFKWQFENTSIIHSSFFISFPGGANVASNARRYRPVRTGGAGRRGRRPLRTGAGGNGGVSRGRPPTGGKVPYLSLRDQSADWSWQSASPVPFSNVFKWQFENTSIIHSSFFIFHFLPWRGKCGEQCSPLRTGAGGSGGRLRAVPTGVS